MPINLLENTNYAEWDRTVDVNCKVGIDVVAFGL